MDDIAYDPADSHVLFDWNLGVVTCNFPDPEVFQDSIYSPFENFSSSTNNFISSQILNPDNGSNDNGNDRNSNMFSSVFNPAQSIFPHLTSPPSSTSDHQLSWSSSLSNRTVCEVNLDNIPMDVVTSDCDSPEPNYAAVFSETFEDSLSDSNMNPSADLEEIELRSRALRSLLLQKQPKLSLDLNDADESPTVSSTTPVDRVTVEPHKDPVQPSSTPTIQTQEVTTRKKFVITLRNSSDSDESSDDQETSTVLRSRIPPQVPMPAHVTTTTTTTDTNTNTTTTIAMKPASSQAKMSRLKTLESAVLQRKMEYLKMKLTAKRQQRIVDEQKKVVRKLSQTLTDLRKRIKHTTTLYKQANSSLTKANQVNLSYQRKLITSQKHYADLTASFEQLSRSIQLEQTKSSEAATKSIVNTNALAEQRRELVLLSLDILQRAKVISPFFAYYQLDSQLVNPTPNTSDNSKLDNLKTTYASKFVVRSAQTLDPFVPICPFSIDGDCKDKDCAYQHPLPIAKRNPILLEKKPGQPTILPLVPDSTQQQQQQKRQKIDRFCEVCKANLTSPSFHDDNPLVDQWHAAFLTHIAPGSKNAACIRKLKQESAKLLACQSTNGILLAHHIACLLMPANLDMDSTARLIGNFLQSADYPLEACDYAIKRSRLRPLLRKRVAQSSIDHLISKITGSTHGSLKPSEHDSFVYLLYLVCYFEFYLQSVQSVLSLLDEIHSKLPSSDHPIHWALWWFKLYLNLMSSLPSEASLYSDLDVPFVPKKKLMAHEQLIRNAALALGISDNPTTDTLSKLDPSQSSFASNCFMNIFHIYVQLMNCTTCYQTAVDMCLHAWLHKSQIHNSIEDSFFSTAIYSLSQSDPGLDWSGFVSSIPEKGRQLLTISHRIEFGFLTACLAWRKNQIQLASSILVETLGNLIFLPTVDHDCVTQAYRSLLNIQANPSSVIILPPLDDRFCDRGQCYLWLSYCLYHMIHSINPGSVLPCVSNYYTNYCKHLDQCQTGSHTFTRLYIYMILSLANMTCHSDPDNYAQIIQSTFLDHPLDFPGKCMPSYFLELVQRVNLSSLTSPGPRHDICVPFVENYGASVVPTLCRSLFALGDRFLAHSLCSIERLENPPIEEFWILYASILMTTNLYQNNRANSLSLKELFEDALQSIPISLCLWRQYIKFMQASNFPSNHILSRAKMVGMQSTITHVLNDVKHDSSHRVAQALSSSLSNPPAAAGGGGAAAMATTITTTSSTASVTFKRGYSTPNMPLNPIDNNGKTGPSQSNQFGQNLIKVGIL